MCTYNDFEWMRLLKQDPPHQEALVCLWEDIYTFCVFQVRHYRLDEQHALDAAEDALRRILQGLRKPDFKITSSFTAWRRTVAANCVNTTVRRVKTRWEREHLYEDSPGSEPRSDPEPADIRMDSASVRSRLQPCIEELPKRQRRVLELRYLAVDAEGQPVERTPQSVAEELGITRDAVNVAAAYARRHLRQCLEQRGYASADDLLLL